MEPTVNSVMTIPLRPILMFLFFFFLMSAGEARTTMRVSVILESPELAITTLDSLLECKIYCMLGICENCEEREKLTIFALALALRKKFEDLTGIHEDLALIILKGGEETTGDIPPDLEFLVKLGYSKEEILNEVLRVKIFRRKIEDSVGITVWEILDFSRGYILVLKEGRENIHRSDDAREQMICDFLKSFLPGGLRIH